MCVCKIFTYVFFVSVANREYLLIYYRYAHNPLPETTIRIHHNVNTFFLQYVGHIRFTNKLICINKLYRYWNSNILGSRQDGIQVPYNLYSI